MPRLLEEPFGPFPAPFQPWNLEIELRLKLNDAHGSPVTEGAACQRIGSVELLRPEVARGDRLVDDIKQVPRVYAEGQTIPLARPGRASERPPAGTATSSSAPATARTAADPAPESAWSLPHSASSSRCDTGFLSGAERERL